MDKKREKEMFEFPSSIPISSIYVKLWALKF